MNQKFIIIITIMTSASGCRGELVWCLRNGPAAGHRTPTNGASQAPRVRCWVIGAGLESASNHVGFHVPFPPPIDAENIIKIGRGLVWVCVQGGRGGGGDSKTG